MHFPSLPDWALKGLILNGLCLVPLIMGQVWMEGLTMCWHNLVHAEWHSLGCKSSLHLTILGCSNENLEQSILKLMFSLVVDKGFQNHLQR